MDFEGPLFEQQEKPVVQIEAEYADFVPVEFKEDPFTYFEKYGVNAKQGLIQRDQMGKIKEDPTAVKILPDWLNSAGEKVAVIAKRINPNKGKVKKYGDPLYEYKMLKIAKAAGFRVAEPIALAQQENKTLLVMEKLAGFSWHEQDIKKLREYGYSDEDLASIQSQAELLTADLSRRFAEEGIIRMWHLKDMMVDIDIENKKVRGVIPIDWERTEIKE